MTTGNNKLSKTDLMALKTRWTETVPESQETFARQMINRLKTECQKQAPDRPLNLDLRGITLFHEDLSHLDLSGYDFSYASLNRCDLTGAILSYSVCHKNSPGTGNSG